MNDSRRTILDRLRARVTPDVELPDLDALAEDAIRYDDPATVFAELVDAVGGSCRAVGDLQVATRVIGELPAVIEAGGLEKVTICSLVPELGLPGVSLDQVPRAHALEHVFLAVVRGEFGVAENGAIWISDRHMRHRALLFLAQHLVVLLPAAELVHNMHEAYRRLSLGQRSFGLFLSGASKTADIEQSLVIGAHGARSLTVLTGPV